MRCSRWRRPLARCGGAITGTGTASTRTARRSTAAGVGRPWPLLTGERAHYEIAAGRHRRGVEACPHVGRCAPARPASFRSRSGTPLTCPTRELRFGGPSGSAMPLVWAHAEHLKLRRSLHDGRVYDMPLQTRQRYVIEQRRSPYAFWRFNHKLRTMPQGRRLRVETLVPTLIHWSVDGWRTTHDTDSRATRNRDLRDRPAH